MVILTSHSSKGGKTGQDPLLAHQKQHEMGWTNSSMLYKLKLVTWSIIGWNSRLVVGLPLLEKKSIFSFIFFCFSFIYLVVVIDVYRQ